MLVSVRTFDFSQEGGSVVKARHIVVLALCLAWAQDSHAQWPYLWDQTPDFSNLGDRNWAIAADNAGNVIAAGSFSGAIDFGGGLMFSQGSADISVVKYNSQGTHVWSKQFGGIGYEIPLGLDVDANNDIVMTGSFRDSLDFGGGKLDPWYSEGMFLVKLDQNGNHIWSRQVGGQLLDGGSIDSRSITCDQFGNILITGGFRNAKDFGGGVITTNGSNDCFLAKYDSAGNHIWSYGFGGTNYDTGIGIATDSNGNVAITGRFRELAFFGGPNLIGDKNGDPFVAKYDSTGAHLWSHGFVDSTNDNVGYGVATDPSDNVFITGFFGGTVDFGGGGITSNGFKDIYIAKYDAGGAHLWSYGIGGPDYDSGLTMETDSSGNVFVGGIFREVVDFGGWMMQSVGGLDVFIAGYDPAGTLIWVTTVGGTLQNDECADIDIWGTNVYAAGHVRGTVDFGGGPVQTVELDGFVVAYGPKATGIPGQTPSFSPSLFASPNPFNPITTIRYEIPAPGLIDLSIYDIKGRLVDTLVRGFLPAGLAEIAWNGTDSRGSAVSSGIYLARLQHRHGSVTRKIALIK